jgi:hypothetical protein
MNHGQAMIGILLAVSVKGDCQTLKTVCQGRIPSVTACLFLSNSYFRDLESNTNGSAMSISGTVEIISVDATFRNCSTFGGDFGGDACCQSVKYNLNIIPSSPVRRTAPPLEAVISTFIHKQSSIYGDELH